MSDQVPSHVVDRLIQLYCEWRSECWDVRSAYEQFAAATPDDRPLAYAAYRAALDREESAAGLYAQEIERIECDDVDGRRAVAQR